jgi:hypothetical protein
MSITAKRKLAYVVLLVSVLIVLLIWKNGIAGEMLRATESPQNRYRVEVAKRKFLTEDAVYLNAYRGKNRLVGRKLLFTGDFLDQSFQELYPNYSWISESVLRIGRHSVSDWALTELAISNSSGERLTYLLLEAYDNKLVAFDLVSNSLTRLTFALSGRLSCQGETLSGHRFGKGVELASASARPERIDIRIAEGTVTFHSPDQSLKPSYCCASDRPDFDHEWMY